MSENRISESVSWELVWLRRSYGTDRYEWIYGKHAVSRLVGASRLCRLRRRWSINGSCQTKSLYNRLVGWNRKAHPDVFNILLQVLDDGRLTDSKGRVVDFKIRFWSWPAISVHSYCWKAWLLMERFQKQWLNKSTRYYVETSNQNFEPNRRHDFIYTIEPRQRERNRWQNGGAIGTTSGTSRNPADNQWWSQTWIAENAYEPAYGARPLKRFITKEVETPLAKEIVAGHVMPKSKVTITLLDGQLHFKTEELEEIV